MHGERQGHQGQGHQTEARPGAGSDDDRAAGTVRRRGANGAEGGDERLTWPAERTLRRRRAATLRRPRRGLVRPAPGRLPFDRLAAEAAARTGHGLGSGCGNGAPRTDRYVADKCASAVGWAPSSTTPPAATCCRSRCRASTPRIRCRFERGTSVRRRAGPVAVAGGQSYATTSTLAVYTVTAPAVLCGTAGYGRKNGRRILVRQWGSLAWRTCRLLRPRRRKHAV